MNKERLQISIDPDLLEEAKREVFWTPGETLSGLVARALRQELERRKAGRGGEDLPDRTGPLREGAPLRVPPESPA